MDSDCWSPYRDSFDPDFNYIDLLDEIWYDSKHPDLKGANSQALSKTNLTFEEKNRACYMLIIAYNLAINKQDIHKKVLKRLTEVGKEASRKWFVTLSFKSDMNLEDFKKWIDKWMKKIYVLELKGVFEIHTKSGLHPHFHFALSMNYKKSKVIQYLWESAGIKKILEDKNYIDVKELKDYHLEYIDGKKKDEKKEFVEKDIEFRKNNDIPEIYKKI